MKMGPGLTLGLQKRKPIYCQTCYHFWPNSTVMKIEKRAKRHRCAVENPLSVFLLLQLESRTSKLLFGERENPTLWFLWDSEKMGLLSIIRKIKKKEKEMRILMVYENTSFSLSLSYPLPLKLSQSLS